MCSYEQSGDHLSAGASTLEDLEREICELAAHIAAATCRWLELLAEFDDRGGWAEWGIKSCAHWLSWRCSLGLRAAREHVRVAHRLKELPVVKEAFSRGELSYCKVRALTRVATAATEVGLVEIARHATGAQLEKLIRGYAGALSATLGAAERAIEGRYLRWNWEDDGSLRLEARLPADAGAIVLNGLRAAEEQRPEDMMSTEPMLASPAGAARADALVALARSAVDGSRSGRAGAGGCELVVHVDAGTLASDASGRALPRRGRAGGGAGDGSTAGMRRRGGANRRAGWAATDGGPADAHDPAGAAAGSAEPGRGMSVPWVHARAVPARASHPALGEGRADDAREPRSAVLLPPSAGTRGRVRSGVVGRGRGAVPAA